MHKNKVIIITVIAVVLTLVIVILNHSLRNNSTEKRLSDESYRAQLQQSGIEGGWKTVTAEDMRRFLSPDRDFSGQKIKDRFTGSVVNHDTLQFFRFMDDLFKDSKDIAENLEKARQYLHSVLPAGKAGQMFDLYKTYVNYQADMQTKMKDWSITGSSREALDNLGRIREYRRALFGKETADLIFGVSEKSDEYDIRRRMILADAGLYGLEKERRLRILNEMMWGSETLPHEENRTSYMRYQEKLSLYDKDLSGARSDAEKEATLERLRKETFSPEELQRMEDAKRAAREDAGIKEQYAARQKEILDSNLDSETKNNRIRDLQDEVFGSEAPAARRQEAIQQGLEEAKKKAALDAKEAGSMQQHKTPEEALEDLNKKIRQQQIESERWETSR